MGLFLVYILKSSLCLAAFYLFYKLLLSRDTFHRFNRVVLLLIFILAVAIPWINIPVNEDFSYPSISLNIEQLLEMAYFNEQGENVSGTSRIQPSSSWLTMVSLVYFAGVAVTLLFSAISMLLMMRMLTGKENQKIKTDSNVTIIIHKNKTAPFSWMRYIAISEQDYLENGKEIICHEMAHINGRHSVDLIICEIVKSLHWFNPASWLLKQELKNIHEYQADNAVITQGTDARQYQLLLIKKAVGDRLYTIANSFNHSKLKNRITMISKRRSNLWATLKVLYVFPLSLVAVAAFATEEVSLALAPVSELKITDFIQTDTTKTKKKTIETKTVEKEESAKRVIKIEKRASGSLHHDTLLIRRSAGDTSKIIVKKEINAFVYDSGSDFKVATFTSSTGDSVNVIVFVDGIEKEMDVIKQIDPKDIKEIKVFKGSKAVAEYGERAKDGVLVVTTKGTNSQKDSSGKAVEAIFTVSEKAASPLYIIDGVIQDKVSLEKITDPKRIASIKVLKGDAAIKEYGDKGKDGVILITLKK